MTATIKTSVLQNASSATANITLDTNGNEIIGGTTVMTSAFTMRNKIINGAMVIDQRNNGASVTTSTTNANIYLVDRWCYNVTAASKFTAQQNAGSVTPPAGFSNYLGITSTSAYSVSSSDALQIRQAIEGLNVADLGFGTANAQTITISFWVYSSLTGTFGSAVCNYNGSRSYPFSYSISTANTWTKINVTIAGDTTGTWLTTNGVGIYLLWSMGTGSSFSGTAGAWVGSYTPSVTGAVSVVGTSGATFYITGVQLEIGTIATPFEYRNYQQELAMCQRYCYRLGANGTSTYNWLSSSGSFGSTTNGFASGSCPVVMRTTPSLVTDSSTLSNYAVYTPNGGAFNPLTSISFNAVSNPNDYFINFGIASGGTAGQVAYLCQNNQTTYGMYFQAEL
jgi:hypothetical protein